MTYCPSCGTSQETDAFFCSNCGTRMNTNASTFNNKDLHSNSTNGIQYLSQYNHLNRYESYKNVNPPPISFEKRTTELTIVLVLQYIGLAILFLLAMTVFIAVPIAGIFLFVIVGLDFWLITSLQGFSETARIIMIILLVLGLFFSFSPINILGLLFSCYQLYVLVFHQPTIALFKKTIRNDRISRSYYNKNY